VPTFTARRKISKPKKTAKRELRLALIGAEDLACWEHLRNFEKDFERRL
jgi:hypothetical protein